MVYSSLAIADERELRFGVCAKPLALKGGLTIGAGEVYPELNFTLPPMPVDASTMPEVRRQYREIAEGSLRRAAELGVPGVVLEFEALPPMTQNPDWGMEVVEILLEAIEDARTRHGLKAALRATPNDTREMERPPRMRDGQLYDNMIELFARAAQAGAGLLSIESVGGKEVSDEALTMGDIEGVVFALGVLGARDMRFLWRRIGATATEHGAVPAGDTACAFANTAMVLAEQRMIPRVFAAVVRAISAVRSLVAYECGAQGPGKDCGYENVILKAITGLPMAMEGKTAACAHLSSVGNIAGAACDLWSNESVQNVKLLGGMAPVCYMEQLAYDCRLFNRALAEGQDSCLVLRRWLVDSDYALDPQAAILAPASAVRIAGAIVAQADHLAASVAAGLEAIAILEEGRAAGALRVDPREAPWLDTMRRALEGIEPCEAAFTARMMDAVDATRFRPGDYEIG
jgi:methanol--5-hydroxybenzimidazolylcobamide Co-methyltransferase